MSLHRLAMLVLTSVVLFLALAGCGGGGGTTPDGPPIIASVNFDGLKAGDPGASATFSLTASNAPTSFTWNFGGGATPNLSTDASPVVTLGAEGAYSGTVTATNASGDSGAFDFTYTVGDVTVIDADQTLASLTVAAGETVVIENNAVVTVTGDVSIAGTLSATDSAINLRVAGDVAVTGTITTTGTVTEPANTDPAGDADGGFFLEVDGDLLMNAAAFTVTGDVIITDDAAQFDRTLDDIYDEADSASGDLPTLVPLPPEDDVFGAAAQAVARATAQAPPPAWTVTGPWNLAARPGDKPIVLFRFNNPNGLPLNLDDWTLTLPPGNAGPAAAPAAGNANGGNGKNGMNLNIWNNTGPINIVNDVTINLAPGGNGGNALATCGIARAGNGGKPGNFRMTAAGGINVAGGTLGINPGAGGNGGEALAQNQKAANGCPGATGGDSNATGGNGAENRKRFFLRGNVAGVANISVSDVVGGDGGPGIAHGCDGGDANVPCCPGGPGGTGTARGGNGGNASLNLSGSGITHNGGVDGGFGGDAEAIGGAGGHGTDCKWPKGGDGGDGKAATATAGNGGNAEATGGALAPTGGHTGNSDATGGNGGDGGDVGFGVVGFGGALGTAVANAGTAGNPGGLVLAPTATDGNPGADGVVTGLGLKIYCIPMAPLVPPGGPIPPGPRPNIPISNTAEPPLTLGDVDLDLQPLDVENPNFFSNQNPVPHIGFDTGQLVVRDLNVTVAGQEPGTISGIEIETLPLFNNFDAGTVPQVVVFDTNNQPIGEPIPLPGLRDHNSEPPPASEEINTIQVPFPPGITAANFGSVAIRMPGVGFITIFRVYIIDP